MARALSAALAVLCALAMMPGDANADFWDRDQPRQVRIHHHKPVKVRRSKPHKVHRPAAKVVEPVREDVGPVCSSRIIDVVSTGHQTIANARAAAQTAWRAKTQMLIGGIYMDPSLSEDERWLCTISDPRDTLSGRMSEAAATLSGNDGEIYRCYYAARPCRANVQRGE